MKQHKLVLIGFLLLIQITLFGQKVGLDFSNAPLEEVINAIETKTDFKFLYNKQLVDVSRKISITVKDKEITAVLSEILKGSNVNYTILGKQIVLSKIEEKEESQTLSGKITDKNGEPLVGVSVLQKGTTRGVVSDADGNFAINVAQGTSLRFSSVGYKDVEITAAAGMAVSMEDNAQNIDDVVVVGYGTQRKRDISGAIVSIKPEDAHAGMVTNTAQLLQGRAAGVQIRTNSGEPGGAITIRVRGASSISSNNDPLYVIDGIQTILGNNINPQDIESIEILKDASATAIYGARGANGVIIITTKRGKAGIFSVDYSYNASIKNLNNPWDLMNAQDIINFQMRTWEQNGSQGNPPYTPSQLEYKGKGTDWIKAAARTAWTQQHQFNIAGGGEKLMMNISGGYLDDQGILLNTDFNRFSTRLNVDYKLTDRVRFGANAYLARTDRTYQQMGTNATNNNMLYNIFSMSPLAGLDEVNVFGETQKKPQLIKMLNEVSFDNVSNDVYASVHGEADIVKDILTARIQYTYYNSNTKNRSYYPKITNIGSAAGGLAEIGNYKNDDHQLDAILTYNQVFNQMHNVKFMVGTTYLNKLYTEDLMSAQGFSTDEFKYNNMGAAENINYLSSYQYGRASLSYFARAEYVLKDKYILNASLRADGASNFGEGNKWGYFPAISLAWQMGDESFMEVTKPIISGFKWRTSYGITGNDGIDPYLSLRKYGTASVYLGGDGVVKGLYPTNPANPNLKWESTNQWNFGVSLSFVNRRIELDFDYYIKTTKDLLNRVVVSTATGGFANMMQNNGKVRNSGWELYIRSNNIVTPNFTWSTTLNLAQNKNMVLEYNQGAPTYLTIRPQGWYDPKEYSVLKEGSPMSTLYGYVFKGILQKSDTYSPQPKSIPGDPIFEDTNGDGEITPDDRVTLGSGTPDITVGLGNTFSFYNFDVTLYLDASLGHKIFNLTRMIFEDEGRLNASTDKWTQQNPSNTIPRAGYRKDSGIQYGSHVNSRFIEDASYLRIQNIEIGYSIPFKNWTNAYKIIKGLRLHVGVQNAFIFTKYTGFTPEVSVNGGNAIAQGLDYNTYPSYRQFNFGAKIIF